MEEEIQVISKYKQKKMQRYDRPAAGKKKKDRRKRPLVIPKLYIFNR